MDLTDIMSVLPYLPPGNPIRFERIVDMSGDEQDAVVWRFTDKSGIRYAYFSVPKGEYLGEAMAYRS